MMSSVEESYIILYKLTLWKDWDIQIILLSAVMYIISEGNCTN